MPNVDEIMDGEDDVASDAVEQVQSEFDDDDMDFDATEESFFDKLWADSPDKDLDEYDKHPLNFRGSEGNARICRAIEGFGLDAKKAIVDAVIGIAQEAKELDLAKGE